MRICVIYDCLYPHTVGGAERWYRDLVNELVAKGHEVTYVTRRQWDRGSGPTIPGVRVVGLEPSLPLYDRNGRRRITEAIAFGAGVFAHLLRHGRRYDVVHTASFPYFSLLAVGATRRMCGFDLAVDWHEIWTHDYWAEYLGGLSGRFGWLVQRLCLRPRQHAYCFSQLHAARLREYGVHGDVVVLTGQYAGTAGTPTLAADPPTVVYIGRHLPEKGVADIVPAVAAARLRLPTLRAEIFGDGPDRARVEQLVEDAGLRDVIAIRGFVDADVLTASLARSLCLVLPSRREGFGKVVVEAAAAGVPSVVVAGADNAAVELIEDGVNGFVAASASADDLAAAIVRVYDTGEDLRHTTRLWFATNAERLSLEAAVTQVVTRYATAAPAA